MSHVTDAMHQHHQQLLDHLSEHVRLLTDRPYDADPTALATFLKADLMPHAAGEERSLYPVVDPLIKAHGTATATMSVDHQVIGDYVAIFRLHLRKEEEVYLPFFEKYIAPDEQQRVLDAMHETAAD